MTAAFENRRKASEIGVNIGERVDQRVADTGLRGQMNDIGKPVLLEQGGHSIAVGEIKLDEADPAGFLEITAAGFLQRRIIICIQVIKTDDVAAVIQQRSSVCFDRRLKPP